VRAGLIAACTGAMRATADGRLSFAGRHGSGYLHLMQKMVGAVEGVAGPASLRMGAPEWGLLGLHSMLWGSAYFFAELAVPEIPVLTIAAFRLIPAALLMAGICLWLGYRLPATSREWRRLILLAAVNNVAPMLLILWAQRDLTGGLAAVFNATTPLFGVFLAHAFTQDERLSITKLTGILVGIAGVAVLVGADLPGGLGSGAVAKLALLGAALCYAIAGVYARRFPRYPPQNLAIGQMIGALALSMPIALLVDQPWKLSLPSAKAAGAVAAMGLFASALAALCYFTVLKRAGATNAMLATLLVPLTPIVLGGLFLGETLAPHEITGAGIIALALLIIDGRLFTRLAVLPRAPHTRDR
jgi:drug/metabolite transporter (DMT)-like permease